MSISVSQVQHFLTTVKYMNMNRAAKELFISQPGLSLSISRLESELGLTLFYRDNNKLLLSQEGKCLLPLFEQIRDDTDALLSAAASLSLPAAKEVSISFSGSAYFFSSFLVAGPLGQYNNALTKLCYVEAEQAVKMLLSAQIDFAISATPLRHPQITTEYVLTNPIGFVVLSTHPLAGNHGITAKELEQEKIHGLTPNRSFRRLCDSFFFANGIHISYFTEESHHEYYQRMVSQNCVGGFLSTETTFKENFQVMGDYVFLPLKDMDLSQQITISYLTDGNCQHIYADLLDDLKKHIRKVNAIHNRVGDVLSRERLNFFEQEKE